MQSDPARRNNFITERLPTFIYRDCGTGAGGFKAGNACAKGGEGGGEGGGKPKSKREPNYKKLEKELLVPASLLVEGVLELDSLQDIKLIVHKAAGGRTRLTTETENKELREQVKTGKVDGVEYRYVIEGADENYNLDVAIEFENTYADDGQGAKIVDKDGNPVRTAAVNFMINKMYKEGDDENIQGQGLKITTLVEQSITHLIKSCPSQKEFNFQGVGVGRNGIARRLLYRRLANRIAAKVGGKVKETASNFTNSNGVVFISTDFQIQRSASRSVRGASQELIAHFNYTYDPALVDPVSDKAAQKFWELDENEDRDCGTGAGGFKTGNECSKSTGQGVHKVEVEELNPSRLDTEYAKRDFLSAATVELNTLGCGEDVACEDGFNSGDVELTDSQKECLFLYSGDANADLLKSPTYKWVEPAEDNDIGYKEETIDFLRDTGRIDGDFDYDGSPLDEDKFNIIQDGIHAINDELMSAASTTDLNLPKGFELYRGMSVNNTDSEQFLKEISKDGASLDTDNVSSWSKDGSIAAQFARLTKISEKVPVIMFGTKFTNGIDMAQQETAVHADESEIVVPPSRFYVKRVQYQRSDKTGKLVGIRVHVEGLAD